MATTVYMMGEVKWTPGASVKSILNAAKHAIAAAGRSYSRTIQDEIQGQMDRSPHKPMGQTLMRGLRENITTKAESDLHQVVGTRHWYAHLREFGGLVTAKNRIYLAIPLNYAAEQMQLKITNPNASDPVKNSLYHAPVPLVAIRSKKGNLLLFAKAKHGAGKFALKLAEPQYLLKKSTMHRPHPFMRPSVEKGFPDALKRFRETFAAFTPPMQTGVKP